ncbi:uncharacterized protein LOC134691053 [Mytilus trossulus]|uniref:uncharacterized protein LOC134691053 n=1 Tax=Mytilus trossulus TaxID=6551 RepID=UPI003006B924
MKVPIILTIALAVLLILVDESEADCRTRCRNRCRSKGYKCYSAFAYGNRCTCRCLDCASVQNLKFSENKGSSQIFPQMDAHENNEFAENTPKEHAEHGETGI